MAGRRLRILLTNDDGIDSPLLVLATEILQELGDVAVAVPATEQSWKGKSMTRLTTLEVNRQEVAGLSAWTVSGTPADCVNLAIHNLLPAPPDLVVSGINVGINTGLGFLLASGTIGGCLEGNIAGIRGLALSQHLRQEEFDHWESQRRFDSASLARLRMVAAHWIPELFTELVAMEADPVTWSVNFPISHGPDTKLVNTYLGHTFYSACFVSNDQGYRHRLRTVDTDPHPLADGHQVTNGNVAATRIDIRRLSERPPGPPAPRRVTAPE